MKNHTLLGVVSVIAIVSVAVNLFSWFSPGLEGRYPLLAKRLFISNPNDLLINFTNLRTKLNELVDKQDQRVGIYFEYLPTGTSININGNNDFFRASLVKLPGIMRAYKLIEAGKLTENTLLEVSPTDINPLFGEKDRLKAGDTRTLAELTRLALTESNNTAYQTIFTRVNNQILGGTDQNEQTIRDVYDYLDIPRSETGETQNISPKNFASILKSLYFSAYLNYEDSSKLLTFLTESAFNDWLPEPVPDEIRVAHKFGVYDLSAPQESQVHSDCGIVYLPKRPYLLCVMINSADREKSSDIIKAVSGNIYNYLTKQ